jgi:lysophospholipase L1-like esterase
VTGYSWLTLLLLSAATWDAAGEVNAPPPRVPADQPMPQDNPLFALVHRELLNKAKAGDIDLYFLGDSITRRWHGNDYPRFQANWRKNFFGWNAANFGWGGDRTENVLWRLEHGELDGVHPKVIVLLIGTNNVGEAPPQSRDAVVEDVTKGIKTILGVLQQKAPNARIVLMGIMPRNENGSTALMPTINRINERIAKFAGGNKTKYLNINDKLADPAGQLRDEVTEDGLHLSIDGYQIWADALKPLLTQWLGPPAETDEAPPATGIPSVSRPPRNHP